ncbi:MAG: hypothetical protein JWL69_3508 [Phycisphaerales bacterium]|nr:hypothetical protein [Phycisphaerales bacterium]
MASTHPHTLFGLAAEFESAAQVLAAARAVAQAGYRRADAYMPFPVEGVGEALGVHRTRIPLLVLIGGVFGACLAFVMLLYANVISYPWNVGGKPPNSWPAWIPITFEVGVLFASFAAFFGMFALNGLPMPYHPVFNVPDFTRASRDRFFIVIESSDKQFDPEQTRQFLEGLKPIAVREVPR